MSQRIPVLLPKSSAAESLLPVVSRPFAKGTGHTGCRKKTSERSRRRHFATSRKSAGDTGSGTSAVMNILAGQVLPDHRTPARLRPFRPQVDALAEARAEIRDVS
jgi:hypothetical protein